MKDPDFVDRHLQRINGTTEPKRNEADELMQEIRDARDPVKAHIRRLNERAKDT